MEQAWAARRLYTEGASALILGGGHHSRRRSPQTSGEQASCSLWDFPSDLPPAPDKEISTAETLGSVTRRVRLGWKILGK